MVRKRPGGGDGGAGGGGGGTLVEGSGLDEYALEELLLHYDQKMVGIVRGCIGLERLLMLHAPVVHYLVNIIEAQQNVESQSPDEVVVRTFVSFLIEFSCFDSEAEAKAVVETMISELRSKGLIAAIQEDQRLLKAPVQLGKFAEAQLRQTRMTNVMTGMAGAHGALDRTAAIVDVSKVDIDFRGAAKEARREKKEQAKKEALAAEYEDFMRKRGLTGQSHVKIHGNNKFPNGGEIKIDGAHINMGKTVLLRSANLHITAGRRYGLIGRNGCGKTTLLRHVSDGELEGISPFLQILHIEQEIMGNMDTPIQVVLSADVERANLMKEEEDLLTAAGTDAAGRLADVYARMEEIDAHGAEARAAQILTGLSFDQQMMKMPTKSLSGGWRMRVSLARALFISPDILLLDEPTNHLDLHAVLWLETYLSGWQKTVIIVSHSRTFLNAVATDIIDYRDQDLKYYRGNYDFYEGTRAELLRTQSKQHETQQKQVAHMQEFIDKFRCNAKRASMVQSRIKAMEKMQLVAAVVDDASFSFKFPEPESVPNPFMQIVDVTFGYNKDKILFRDVNFGLDVDSRIALVGDNGSGKSTFLNVIAGQLEPLDGRAIRNPKARIGRFTQHHVDSLNLQKTPVEQMQAMFPGADKEQLRAHIGKLGLSGEKGIQPIYTLSGGQKSRIAFAILTWTSPHLLLLDEPTNHLDIDTVDALIMALNGYKGGVIIVTHDEHLIKAATDEIWICGGGKLTKWKSDFDAYKKKVRGDKNF